MLLKINKYSKVVFIQYVFVLMTSCYEEIEIHSFENDPYLMFDDIYAGIDFEKAWILMPITLENNLRFPSILSTNLSELYIDGAEYSEGDWIDLAEVRVGDSLCISFQSESGRQFDGFLYFTNLPIIQIYCRENIPDEPKVFCDFILSYSSGETGYSIVSKAGVELRGRSAKNRPKKSYGIELWENNSGNDTRKESLLGMRNDDDWILDAMYIDKARMRNKVSMEIWRDICKSSRNVNVSGKPYTESRYIELFVNLEYKGIYCLTERFDRKQLDLEAFNGSLQGVQYKSESWSNTIKFISLADTNTSEYWDGWEQKYPDPDEYTCWRPLYDFTSFVINSSDIEFEQQVSNYLNFDNLIDYFLFINTCTAFDNMGMNMIYARSKKDSQFIIYPWDLDASWGRNWDSTFLCAEHWLSNKCYNRLFELNVETSLDLLQVRWGELRRNLLTHASLIDRFAGYSVLLMESGAFKREKFCWPEMDLDIELEIAYISNWLDQRIVFMDNEIYDADNIDWDKIRIIDREWNQ